MMDFQHKLVNLPPSNGEIKVFGHLLNSTYVTIIYLKLPQFPSVLSVALQSIPNHPGSQLHSKGCSQVPWTQFQYGTHSEQVGPWYPGLHQHSSGLVQWP